MFKKVNSLTIEGLEVHPIEVESDTGRGLPGVVVVGLPDKAIMESRDRVKTAMTNTGVSFPRSRVTINLAPGDLKKEGPYFDVPIALGIMLCIDFIKPTMTIENHWFVGELALNGDIRPVNGTVNMAQYVERKGGTLVVPKGNYEEASLVNNVDIVAVENLNELIQYIQTGIRPHVEKKEIEKRNDFYQKDFADVKGQPQAKRALMIAAAGNHNVLMLGPPGSGKSMLAERLPSILPKLSHKECIDITCVYSVAGLLKKDSPFIFERPFRAPHHTISDVALIGGGSNAKPGEISLASKGVIFLDELPEFKRGTLEVLRQPLESGRVVISRAKQVAEYPCEFVLVAAMNPCPCGYYGSRVRGCRCSSTQVEKYKGKISGPLLDRIDMHVEVTDQSPKVLRESTTNEMSSSEIKKQVDAAVAIQTKRYEGLAITRNSEVKGKLFEKVCEIDSETEKFLMDGMQQLSLSARAYHKILVVARTIADLEGSELILLDHVAEALNYRMLDQNLLN